MQTATARGPTSAARFVLQGVAGSLALFGLLRLNWIAAHVVLPVTRAQSTAAVALFGTPPVPVEATLACSGADALALCLGAVLAYPAPWLARLAAAAGGAVMILLLNTVRIGTLGQAAASPAWFDALHLYIWPLVLTLAIAGYVFAWMRLADRTPRDTPHTWRLEPSRRFIVLTVIFLVAFLVTAPFYLESPAVLAIAGLIASMAASILGALGMETHATANILWTSRGGFLVTQECISTPLIPLYLAAICSYATTWTARLGGLAAALPLFIALGILRLLVVAVPDAVASPLFLVHAFYQLLLAFVIVFVAAFWYRGHWKALGYATAGIVVGVIFVQVIGPIYAQGLPARASLPLDDPQGAIGLLPAFQVGLYLALWIATFLHVGWQRVAAGLVLLAGTQAASLLALQSLFTHTGLTPHVRDVRALAVGVPVLIFVLVASRARPRR